MARPVLYLEPVGGIAGDMFLAAALDLGVPLAQLEGPLQSLDLGGWRFLVKRDERHHLFGTHVDVVVDEAEHAHAHRSLNDIARRITASKLPERAKDRAKKVFHALAEVEAAIHDTTVDEVHFHEVGAVDSIVDICGAVLVLELLGDPVVYSAPPPLGSGTIRIAHGVVPVPVPATLALLKDVPVRFEGLGELTTPTGAALLKVLARVEAPPPMVVEKVGYGLGTKDWPDRANVLRFSLGHATQDDAAGVWVLECNLDDCSPQVLATLVELSLERGALDAWILPAVMKKGRPGHLVGVLCEGPQKELLINTLLTESTTLGVRTTPVSRVTLERRFDTVQTLFGAVRMKVGLSQGAVLNAAPEFEDCRALAREAGVPLKDVQAAAIAAWRATR